MRILNEKLWAKTEERRATQHKTYENRPSSREARRSYREKFYFWVRKLFLRFARASFREAFAVDVSQKDKLLLLAGTWTLFILSKAVKPFSSVGGVTEKKYFPLIESLRGWRGGKKCFMRLAEGKHKIESNIGRTLFGLSKHTTHHKHSPSLNNFHRLDGFLKHSKSIFVSRAGAGRWKTQLIDFTFAVVVTFHKNVKNAEEKTVHQR